MFGFDQDQKKKKQLKCDSFEGGEAAAEGGEAADGLPPVDEKKIGTMPSGDYQIHFHIQTGKNFIMPDEQYVDPYVRVEVLGQSTKTTVKNDIPFGTLVNFNEHLFIDLKKMDNEQVEEANIEVTVLNKGYFKGDIIGQISLSMSRIYHKKNHVMMHQRIGLTNPNGDDFSQMTGSLVVSVNITAQGDDAMELKMASKSDIDASKIIMPSSVRKQYKQLFLRAYMATNLPKMDSNFFSQDSINAYLKVLYKGKKLKTVDLDQKNNIVPWMKQFLIPVEIPVINSKLTLQVYDKDSFVDELVATTELNIKSMIKYDQSNTNVKGKAQCKWINLYGAPIDRSGSVTDEMNKNPDVASNWKGRIVVEYWCIDHKYPEFKIQNIPADFDRKLYDKTIAPNNYFIIGEFGQALCLPGKENYKLKFALADMSFKSKKPKNQKADYCRWDERFGGDQFEMPYSEGKYMPTFYIYLIDEDGVEVCFFRDSVENFRDPNAPLQWRCFQPNKSHGVVTDEQKAGYFSFRLYFHELDRQGPFDPKKISTWKKSPPARQTPYKARVAIYQCENLPPADELGHSDPYVHVYDYNHTDDESIKTDICEDTNNPIFYEVKEFTFCSYRKGDKIDLENSPPIILNVFDYDDGIVDSKDDLIGRAVISLPEAASMDDGIKHISFDDEIPYPAWYPIKKHYDDDVDFDTCASILVSIQIIDMDESYALPAEAIQLNSPPPKLGNKLLKMPDLQMEEYKCEIVTLGLRDLVSTGLMSVNKPYIKFAIKSLLPVSKANAIDNVFTQPHSKGANPTIRTTVQFEVKMPSDPTFTPRMTCEVYDSLFMGGVGQPQIGTFTLSFGEVMKQMREKLEDDIQKTIQYTKAVEQVRSKIEASQGEDRLRATQVCATISSKHIDSIPTLTQQEKLGIALLKKLEAEGLELPTTNAVKNRKGMYTPISSSKQPGEKGEKESKVEEKYLFLKGQTKEHFDEMSHKSNKEQSEEISRAVGGDVRKKVQIAFEADLAAKKRQLEMDRKADQAQIAARPGAYGNKIMPIYKYDERLKIDREVDPPPSSIFKAVGYDKNPADQNMHYRRYYPDELEQVKDKHGNPIINSPFVKEYLFRAKSVKQSGLLGCLFSGDSGSDFVSVKTGYFKGTIRCYNEKDKVEADAKLKENMEKLIEAIISVYEIENYEEKCTIESSVIQQLDTLDAKSGKQALDDIRQVIEGAGLEKLNIFPLIDNISFQSKLLKRLNEVQTCRIKLYMVEGFNFAQRDLFSASDPFLKVYCGEESYNDRDNYQLDTAQPKFFKCFTFQVQFPGSPSLVIEAYDYDAFFGDDLIGITKIDLDDRFYSQSWQAIEDKPIEYRDLFEESSSITQGVVKLWVEIDEVGTPAASMEPLNINSAPILDFEIRVVIWKTKEIQMMDVEGTSDVFIRVFFDDDEDQTTDTHWRCQNGTASFNYRLLFPIKSQREVGYTLNFQAWDKDIIASNDLIGSCALPIDYLFNDSLLTDTPRYINSKYFEDYMKDQLKEMNNPLAEDIEFESDEKDKFWIPVHRLIESEDKTVKAGEILISVAVIPNKVAQKAPQGTARQEPNSDPYCPPPEGRIQLSINPITMFNQMVGPAVRRQIYMILLCVACAFLCTMMAPMIFSNIITKVIVG